MAGPDNLWQPQQMETIIKLDKKTIWLYITTLSVIGAAFLLPTTLVGTNHDEATIFFEVLLNALWFFPLMYLLIKLISSFSPQLIISHMGIKFKDSTIYIWDEIKSYEISKYSYTGGDLSGKVTNKTLIFKFINKKTKQINITYFPLDKPAEEILMICETYRNVQNETA